MTGVSASVDTKLQHNQHMIEHQAVHLKEQQERSIAARISSPKCRADFVLRHEAEADEVGTTDGG